MKRFGEVEPGGVQLRRPPSQKERVLCDTVMRQMRARGVRVMHVDLYTEVSGKSWLCANCVDPGTLKHHPHAHVYLSECDGVIVPYWLPHSVPDLSPRLVDIIEQAVMIGLIDYRLGLEEQVTV